MRIACVSKSVLLLLMSFVNLISSPQVLNLRGQRKRYSYHMVNNVCCIHELKWGERLKMGRLIQT